MSDQGAAGRPAKPRVRCRRAWERLYEDADILIELRESEIKDGPVLSVIDKEEGQQHDFELEHRMYADVVPYPDEPGKTHYDGCYRAHGHHNCAVRLVQCLEGMADAAQRLFDDSTRLRAELVDLKSKNMKLEQLLKQKGS